MYRRLSVVFARGVRRDRPATAGGEGGDVDWATEDSLDDLIGIPRGTVDDDGAVVAAPGAPAAAPVPPPGFPCPSAAPAPTHSTVGAAPAAAVAAAQQQRSLAVAGQPLRCAAAAGDSSTPPAAAAPETHRWRDPSAAPGLSGSLMSFIAKIEELKRKARGREPRRDAAAGGAAEDLAEFWAANLPRMEAQCAHGRNAALLCRAAMYDPTRCALPPLTVRRLAVAVARDAHTLRPKSFAYAARALSDALVKACSGGDGGWTADGECAAAAAAFARVVVDQTILRYGASGASRGPSVVPGGGGGDVLLDNGCHVLEALASLRPLYDRSGAKTSRDSGASPPAGGVPPSLPERGEYNRAAICVLAAVESGASRLKVTDTVHAVVVCRQLAQPALQRQCQQTAAALVGALQLHDARFVNALHFTRVVFAVNALFRYSDTGPAMWPYLKAKYTACGFSEKLPRDTAAKVEAVLTRR